MEVLDKLRDSVIWHVSILWSWSENFCQIQNQEPYHDSTCPPSPFLVSWRTGRFLTLIRCNMKCINPLKLLWKIPSNSNFRNPIKTQPVLQVPSWSFGGYGGSWQSWVWCQMKWSILMILLWDFHQEPTFARHLHCTFKISNFIGKYQQTDKQSNEQCLY